MMYRFLFTCAILAWCSTSHAESSSNLELTPQGKHGLQKVILADGSVVDRLTLPAAASGSRKAGFPATPEAWLARMIDPTKNGLAAKNPELFAEWLDAVTEPRFMTALATVAMRPESYSLSLGKVANPATFRNWAEFADPQVYLRWMSAGIDPRFYQAIFNRMTESGKLRRWGFYQEVRSSAASDPDAGLPGQPSGQEGNGKPARAKQEWLQMPARSTQSNPWLSNSVNYRY